MPRYKVELSENAKSQYNEMQQDTDLLKFFNLLIEKLLVMPTDGATPLRANGIPYFLYKTNPKICKISILFHVDNSKNIVIIENVSTYDESQVAF